MFFLGRGYQSLIPVTCPHPLEGASTPRKQAKALMKKILCPEGARTEDCFHRSCSDCRHLRGDLEEEIEAIFQANSISSVLFEKWTTQDRTEVKTFNVPPGDFAKLVVNDIEDWTTHQYVDKQQQRWYKNMIEDLPLDTCLIVPDFSMNYREDLDIGALSKTAKFQY